MKILILGGYGVFGGRLAHLLSDLPQLELLIAGRDKQRAAEFCKSFKGKASVIPLQLDRANTGTALDAEKPALVVDASGPFQQYGADSYGVVEACIKAGVDYLDFADAADFVFGIDQFDEEARQAEIFALSGVSSFPVLTAAVLREIGKDMEIANIEGGIAPSPHAGIGLNVMRAVVGYAGEQVKLTRGGVETFGMGLAESRRYTIAVPGHLPLRNIRFSLVEVPDLQVIPPEYTGLREIWMGAGPVPELLHRILNLLAKARRTIGLPSLVPLSRLFYAVLNLMKFGDHRGGMYVRASGLADGKQVERSWHLLAEGDDGPLIPSMAIEAIVRKMLGGERPASGARSATHALELADYEQLFDNRTIYTGMRTSDDAAPALYQRILGTAFGKLPAPIQKLHNSHETRVYRGEAEISNGSNPLSWLLRKLFGFPSAGQDVPVEVTLKPEGEAERWTRKFGEKHFSSLQYAGRDKDDFLLVEKFGPIAVSLALVVQENRLYLEARRWKLCGIPMPGLLLPNGESFECVEDGRFRFDVEIKIPFAGMIVSYRGWLEEQDA